MNLRLQTYEYMEFNKSIFNMNYNQAVFNKKVQ